jgi:hypothetical protein
MKTKYLREYFNMSLVLLCLIMPRMLFGQKPEIIKVLKPAGFVKPLEIVTVAVSTPGTLIVKDAKGREYNRIIDGGNISFQVAGAAGDHTVILFDKKGKSFDSVKFTVVTTTCIDDGGSIADMFRLFHNGMMVYNPDGVEEITWNNKTYRYFVNWVLDNNNTMKGMQYFSPYSRDLVDLLCEHQQPDGMIWSFVNKGEDEYHYYETAYSSINYFKKDTGVWFVRQPAENHVEYNYVNMIYQHWKASGDDDWMKSNLNCAQRALDYNFTDSARWSKRFQLLKRPYCIDSWDFQVNDEYTPYAPISPTMVIVPGKTKYGIFFGDNTGYYEACNQLAEMLDHVGYTDKAAIYRNRAREILNRLIALSWNGKFFTHFIDEDPSVRRNLGVDEKAQIAQGNMYSINRGLSHEMNVAIIKTYLDLKQHLPVGSPGEWYAIYPPFEKGFSMHNTKWQYMNGGVAGHAAGELARGAYENGYENYASEILNKLYKLGKENGNRIWFAYTGSIPPPPPPARFRCIDISKQANMDLFDQGSKEAFPWMNTTRPGNDMRGLPTGSQVFKTIPFRVIDPAANRRKAVIGVSTLPGYPRTVEVPVNDSAACVYLLHSSSDNIPSNVAGAITFQYDDGSEASQYLMKYKDVTNWWFSSLESDHSGVAWWGSNLCSTKVGVCWAAVENPHPSKKISTLVFHGPLEGGIYAVIGITLADRIHYIRPRVESFGGPDNWAAANAMAALVEGLAGVKNDGLAYNNVSLSPRWTSADIDSVDVNISLPASGGYVAYRYINKPEIKKIVMDITGSGDNVHCRILLPAGCRSIQSALVNDQQIPYKITSIENSYYGEFEITLLRVQHLEIDYQ